jgi:hypothetical protein
VDDHYSKSRRKPEVPLLFRRTPARHTFLLTATSGAGIKLDARKLCAKLTVITTPSIEVLVSILA